MIGTKNIFSSNILIVEDADDDYLIVEATKTNKHLSLVKEREENI